MVSKPVHPGKVLAEELEALGVTPTELSRQIAVPPNRISQIINGKRAISGDTALRLAHWFKTSPEFWLDIQTAHDLRTAQSNSGREIARLPTKLSAPRAVRSTLRTHTGT